MFGQTGPQLFEDFMVCSSNEEAVAAARAVASTAPQAPNPLVILGAPADGKTHLVRALVTAFRRQHPGVSTTVMTTEWLERIWRRAVVEQNLRAWQVELSRLGLLVIEDVQFMDRRRSWSPLLSCVLQSLHHRGGFVVLTRDAPSATAEPPFPAGARTVRLHAPDFDLRAAVARRAAASVGLRIPDDVAEFIAGRCRNLRQVQGAVMRVHASTALVGRGAKASPEYTKLEFQPWARSPEHSILKLR
ncbi:MAG: DnaA/Hda family protein [Myxococcota bacterium]